MKKTIFTLLCIIAYNSIFAQATSVKRLEFDITEDLNISDNYTFGENGIVQRTIDDKKQKIDKENKTITYCKFDTTLQKIKQVDIKIPKKYTQETIYYKSYINTKNSIIEAAYSNNDEFIFYITDIASMNTKTIIGNLPKGSKYQTFQATKDYIYIMGRAKGEYYLLIKNLQTGIENISKIAEIKISKIQIYAFQLNEDNNELYIIAKNYINDKEITTLSIYNNDKKIKELPIRSNVEKKYIMNCSVSKVSDNSYIILGSYNNSPDISITEEIGRAHV